MGSRTVQLNVTLEGVNLYYFFMPFHNLDERSFQNGFFFRMGYFDEAYDAQSYSAINQFEMTQ